MTDVISKTIAILHALISDPTVSGDAERCRKTYRFANEHSSLLENVLDWGALELIEICKHLYSIHNVAPTIDQFALEARRYFVEPSGKIADLLALYGAEAPKLGQIDAEGALQALEGIVVSLTYSPTNPDGPIRRRSDGKFLDGSEGPILSGTPTERFVWFALYYFDGGASFMSVRSLLKKIGGSNEAMQVAIRSLSVRGIVHRIHEPGVGPMVCLHDIHSRRAADARSMYQVCLAEGLPHLRERKPPCAASSFSATSVDFYLGGSDVL